MILMQRQARKIRSNQWVYKTNRRRDDNDEDHDDGLKTRWALLQFTPSNSPVTKLSLGSWLVSLPAFPPDGEWIVGQEPA